MKQITNCPICNHRNHTSAIKCVDYTYSKNTFNVDACNDCGFWFTNPIPLVDKIGEYYESDDYVSHTKSKKGIINLAYHWVKKYSIQKKYSLIKPFLKTNNTLLDYGCGAGDFLAYCYNKGASVAGFEPSETSRENILKEHNISINHTSDIYNEKRSFDVISMWHVLEHVYDLNSDFKQLSSLLNKDGRLIIAVPNRESYDAKKYKEKWAAFDLPRHLYHFSKNDMALFLKKHGFEIEKILPMKFDSFYVSMLSEKHNNGNIIKGVINGLRSNLASNSKLPNHSSLIYIVKNQK